MKLKNNLLGIATMALCLGLASCSDDDELQFSKAQVTNSELKTILEQNGLHFDEQGHLLLDEAANNLKSLNLSGKKISDYKELAVLPNLTELNLSNNDFGPTFDFSILPAQITAVDLTGNTIFDFDNLVKIDVAENEDETVTLVRDFSKLYLPTSAKYNCDEVLAYYQTDKEVDMKLGNEAYNTLREVPDAHFRKLLKKSFPSIFVEGDKIDIAKRLIDPTERAQNIMTLDYDEKTMAVDNIEGFQYIANNKGWLGGQYWLEQNKPGDIEYFPVPATVFGLKTNNVNTVNNFDLTTAKNLCFIEVKNNSGLTSFDLSASTTFGQRAEAGEFLDNLDLQEATNLEELVLPKAATKANNFQLTGSKKIKKLDISQFESMSTLSLAGIPTAEIAYPNLKKLYNNFALFFSIDEMTYNKQSTKDFIQKYYVDNKFIAYGMSLPDIYKSYEWFNHYK